MKIRCLGLDNSRYSTGWSVIDIDDSINDDSYYENMKLIDYGVINTSSIKDEGKTLIYVEEQFTNLFEKYKPDAIAAEQMFVGKNAQTGIVLASIHGIMKLVAAKNNCPITYYSIMSAKSIVTGGIKLKKEDGTRKTGDEMKAEVASAIFNIFKNIDFTNITDDITDAISMVVTYRRMNGQGIGKQSSNVKATSKKKLTNRKELQDKADSLKTTKKIAKKTNKKSIKESTKESVDKTATKSTKKTVKKTDKKASTKDKVVKDKTVKNKIIKNNTKKETVKKSVKNNTSKNANSTKDNKKVDAYETAKKIVASVNTDVSSQAKHDLKWEIIKQQKINELIESNLPSKDKLKNDKKSK